MIKYTIDTMPNVAHYVRQWLFPGGEVGVDVNNIATAYTPKVQRVWVDARIRNSDDLVALCMATDALRRLYPLAQYTLNLPYIPYARQDRVCNEGEALSIKVFATMINALEYDVVEVLDPHSAVAVACLDNVQVSTQFDVFGEIKDDWMAWTLVAPDAGAVKKTEDFAKLVGAKGVISFSKTRNLADGKITGMKCNDEIDPDEKYVVLDDICDGGRTFIELAATMHYVGNIELVVTHGIFSKGVGCVADVYDHIYTTDSFRDDLSHKSLTVIEI